MRIFGRWYDYPSILLVMLKLAVADDHELFRKGTISFLSPYKDLQVVMEASNGRDLLDQIAVTGEPDVILLDIQMPVLDGFQTAEILSREYPDVKVIIVSMYNENRFVLSMLDIGVHGYLLKDSPIEEVVKAIRRVAEEGFYYSEFVNSIIKKRRRPANGLPILHSQNTVVLSSREKDVLQLLCEGKSTSEISGALFISVRTVEGHRLKILEKMEVKNTVAAVAYALKNNLI